jgi:hypothetical protein
VLRDEIQRLHVADRLVQRGRPLEIREDQRQPLHGEPLAGGDALVLVQT